MVFGQDGRLVGKVTDADTGEELVGATIVIEGTTTGTITNFMGEYELNSIPAGKFNFRCQFISYDSQTISNVEIKPASNNQIDFKLKIVGLDLQEVKVVGKANRESDNMLLIEQKNSLIAVQAIGSQELSRKGISDAQGAVAKISGITKQEGVKNVFVRGLGDRCNATFLNGFPVPSEDTEYKNIALDLFSSDMIQSVGVNKVFGATNYSDVAGASINIISKELVGDSDLSLEVSAGANTETLNADFYTQDGVSGFGYAKSNVDPGITSSYTFKNSLDPWLQNLQINQGYKGSVGKKYLVGENKNSLSFLIIGSYDKDFEYRTGNRKSTGTTGIISSDQDFEKSILNNQHLGLLNVNYLKPTLQLSLNSVYIHSNEQSVGDFFGSDGDAFQQAGTTSLGMLRRQRITDNSLIVNQFLAKWNVSKQWEMNTGIAYNMIIGNEPDRRKNYLYESDNNQLIPAGSTGRHQRYFADLTENDANFKFGFAYNKTNQTKGLTQMSFGFTSRVVKDDFTAIEYDHSFVYPITFDKNNVVLDQFFNQNNLVLSKADLSTVNAFMLERNDSWYKVDKYVNSAYSEFVYRFNPSLVVIAGVKADLVDLSVDFDKNRYGAGNPNPIDTLLILPSLNLKYDLSEKNSIRLGLTQTYTLPQSREISPYRMDYEDYSVQGNPFLKLAINYNADLKWDYYISSDELVSIGGFLKVINDPISMVEKASAGGYLTYENITDYATLSGIEFELKKNIFKSIKEDGTVLSKLSFGLNASYIDTYVALSVQDGYTNTSSQLEGATPIIINTDLSHQINKKHFSITNSLVCNYFSDRIFTVGTLGFQDVKEKGLTTLDYVSSVGFNDHWKIGLKVKNILNPYYKRERQPNILEADPIVLSSYKKGQTVSISISYNL